MLIYDSSKRLSGKFDDPIDRRYLIYLVRKVILSEAWYLANEEG